MGYAYSPFNPIIWLLFIGFCVITYVIVKLFHRRYPDYPDQLEKKAEMNLNKHGVSFYEAYTVFLDPLACNLTMSYIPDQVS